MRLGCGWMRVIEVIDVLVRPLIGQSVRIHAQRDRRAAVSHLTADVRDGFARLQQQRREGLPHLVRAAPTEIRFVQHAIERLAHIRLVQEGPSVRRKDPG